MTAPPYRRRRRPALPRRLVLGGAFLVGLAVRARSREPRPAAAQEAKPSPGAARPNHDTDDAGKTVTITAGPAGRETKVEAAAPLVPAGPAGHTTRPARTAEAGPSASSKKRKRVHRRHRRATANSTPSTSSSTTSRGSPDMVFVIVRSSSWRRVLIIALVLWYKMRKTRMLNETMLQLAEKGVVPPAEAMQALRRQSAGGLHRDRRRRRHRCWSRRARCASARRGRTCARACIMGGARAGPDPLFDVRRPLAERARPGTAVRRHRLRLPLVVRGPAARRADPRAGPPAGAAARCVNRRIGTGGRRLTRADGAPGSHRCPAHRARRRPGRPPRVLRARAPPPVGGPRDAAAD